MDLGNPEKTATGRRNERMAPPGFDSIIGQTSPDKYREFIVYDRHQTYPEYRLSYAVRRNNRPSRSNLLSLSP